MHADLETVFLNADSRYIADLYHRYCENPSSVDSTWHAIFSTLGDQASALLHDVRRASWAAPLPSDVPLEPDLAHPAKNAPKGGSARPAPTAKTVAADAPTTSSNQRNTVAAALAIVARVEAYRRYGHTLATLDPLGLQTPPGHPELAALKADDATASLTHSVMLGSREHPMTLAQADGLFRRLYSGTLGIEYMHLRNPEARAWIQHAFEARTPLAADDQRRILHDLTRAEAFERFLQVKFPTAKRFGLEGGESLLPLLETILARAEQQGCRDVVLGMAHRGRLNVLTHIMGKPYAAMLHDFIHGIAEPDTEPAGLDLALDVKYHAGRSHDRGPLHLSLLPNPSHLEMVNPLVQGKVRAKQTPVLQKDERDTLCALGIQIHGDAAFAGQGIVMESLMLSGLTGYSTRGTVHIVINNQVGFTTDPSFSRSSLYCTDVAKMIDAPVLHVNGDDPEAVVQAAELAAAYRHAFGADVVLDLVCYRRHGHNEMDEPAFTQPHMYRVIAQHPTTRARYAQSLAERSILSAAEADAMMSGITQELQQAFQEAGASKKSLALDWLKGAWSGVDQADAHRLPATGVATETLQNVGKILCQVPEGFAINPKVQRQLEQRLAMLAGNDDLDWGMGEALAFATLLKEGTPMRLAGQDSGRGTFSHRHAVWTDQTTGQRYTALQNLDPQQGRCDIIDSPLSELAALGFEIGYAMNNPNALVLWEGQFGDFANGAQVMIDQFLASSETKWQRAIGLTLLLPHGFEGQGPEHSSARLERFLQLCADDNMRVVNCTTPANQFHALRRQIHNRARKPLIAMTPKSLLRLKAAKSPLSALAEGTTFQPVLAERLSTKALKDIQRVVLCSGKVYYDLLEAQQAQNSGSVLLVRLEQLYPFPKDALHDVLAPLSRKIDVVWCQEEPRNMGAWTFVREHLAHSLAALSFTTAEPRYVGRKASASPAVGSDKRHSREQSALVQEALADHRLA